jgi:hypothetical protein
LPVRQAEGSIVAKLSALAASSQSARISLPTPATRVLRVCVHRSHAGSIGRRIEQRCAAPGRLVAAIERCAAAPSAAAGDPSVHFYDEVRALVDELRVQPHDRSAGEDLVVIEKRLLESRGR